MTRIDDLYCNQLLEQMQGQCCDETSQWDNTCADGAVAYGHFLAVGYMDAVSVGAPSRRSDEQLRHEHVPGVGDRDVHLHAVPHLRILHDQVRASSEVDRLQVAN